MPKRVTVPTIIGLIVSFIGSLYLFSGDAQAGPQPVQHDHRRPADFHERRILVRLCDLQQKPHPAYGSVKISLLSLTLATLPALAFISPSTWSTTLSLDQYSILSLFYLTFIGTVLTLGTWNYAVGLLRPTAVGASLYLIPVFAIAAGTLLLGEISYGHHT